MCQRRAVDTAPVGQPGLHPDSLAATLTGAAGYRHLPAHDHLSNAATGTCRLDAAEADKRARALPPRPPPTQRQQQQEQQQQEQQQQEQQQASLLEGARLVLQQAEQEVAEIEASTLPVFSPTCYRAVAALQQAAAAAPAAARAATAGGSKSRAGRVAASKAGAAAAAGPGPPLEWQLVTCTRCHKVLFAGAALGHRQHCTQQPPPAAASMSISVGAQPAGSTATSAGAGAGGSKRRRSDATAAVAQPAGGKLSKLSREARMSISSMPSAGKECPALLFVWLHACLHILAGGQAPGCMPACLAAWLAGWAGGGGWGASCTSRLVGRLLVAAAAWRREGLSCGATSRASTDAATVWTPCSHNGSGSRTPRQAPKPTHCAQAWPAAPAGATAAAPAPPPAVFLAHKGPAPAHCSLASSCAFPAPCQRPDAMQAATAAAPRRLRCAGRRCHCRRRANTAAAAVAITLLFALLCHPPPELLRQAGVLVSHTLYRLN